MKKVQFVWQGLCSRERQILRAFAKHSSDAILRQRCGVVMSLVRGYSPAEVAVSCSQSHVYRVANRFIGEGPAGLADRRKENGCTKVTDYFEDALITAVAGSPQDYRFRRPTWTQELLKIVLAEETGIRVSCTTICRTLARLRIRLGRPKPWVRCPWKKARKSRRLNQITRLVDQLPPDEVAVYVDEVDIHLNPKIGPDWMLPGTQKTVLTPGRNEKRYLAGALDAKTGRLIYVGSDRKNSDLFLALVDALIKRYPYARRIHLILDNYKIHDSKRVQLAMAKLENKVQRLFLPPYCPDHNRIERVWRDLHDNVTRNHRCETMKQLMDEVNGYLRCRTRALRHEYATATAA